MRAAAVVLVALLPDANSPGADVDLSRLDLVRTHEKLSFTSLSPSGLHVVSHAGNAATVMELRPGLATRTLAGHDGNIHDSGWSRDGRTFATTGFDGIVRVWDVESGRCRAAVAAHPAYACSVALSPEGRLLATGGSADPHVKLYDASGGRELRVVLTRGGATYSLGFTGDGAHLVGNQADGHLRVWRVRDGAELLDLAPRSAYVHAYAFSRDGRLVAFPEGGGAVTVLAFSDWIAAAGGEAPRRRTLQADSGGPSLAVFHPAGRHLAAAGADGEVRIWDVASGRQVNSIRVPDGKGARLAFTPDGRSLVVACRDEAVRIYEVRR